jgi:hypothetical protein
LLLLLPLLLLLLSRQVLDELHSMSSDLASEIDDNQLIVLEVVASGG